MLNIAIFVLGVSAAASSQYTQLLHKGYPGHSIRIKQTEFCDDSVRVSTGYVDFQAKHLFFYFFESRNESATDDVVLWVNGGPGASASLGMLMELGPCSINGPNATQYNPYSWNTNANMLFLEQPVGVSWSTADYGQTVVTTEEAALDVAAFLAILSDSLDQVRDKNLHIAGESFGGRYVPLFAAAVYDQNERLKSIGMQSLNLKSIMIGNGLSEWKHMYEGWYAMQCTNSSGLGALQTISKCVRMKQALPRCQKLLDTHCQPPFDGMNCGYAHSFCGAEIDELFESIGRNNYDMRGECYGDVMETLCYPETLDITKFMNLASTRKALGVSPNITFSPVSWEVNSAFAASGDDLQPASYHIEALLNRGIRVLLYVGKQDFSCNWVGNLKMAEHLEWHGQQGFLDTEPSDWTSKNGSTVGWSKTFGDLNFVVVDNAGHMVPHDQPAVALEMVDRWLREEGF